VFVVVLLIFKCPICFCQSGTSPFFKGVAEHEMCTIKGSVYRTNQCKQIPAEEQRLGTNLQISTKIAARSRVTYA
jgi:hypothetical protein